MDVALLFMELTGFGVSSWGAKPFFIENEVISPAMDDGIIERLGGGVLDVALLFIQLTGYRCLKRPLSFLRAHSGSMLVCSAAQGREIYFIFSIHALVESTD